MFSIHARTYFCSPEVSAVEESKEETAVAVAVAAAVVLPDKHSLHPTSHIWKSPHPGRGPPWTQACGAAAPQPDRHHHKQRAGPRQGLMRREGHTHRARRTSRRQRQKEDKEKGAWVGDAVVFLFCFVADPALVQTSSAGCRVCQEELQSPRHCAALCSFTLSLMKMYGDI